MEGQVVGCEPTGSAVKAAEGWVLVTRVRHLANPFGHGGRW